MRSLYYKRNEGLLISLHDPFEWAIEQVFAAGELTFDDGACYICKSPHTADAAHEPGVGEDWEDVFLPFATGRQGDQGLQGIPGGTLNWRGAYNAGTTYAANDGVISSEGRGCYALQASTGHAPPSYPTLANAYWSVFAERGSSDASTLSGATLSVDTVANPGVDTKIPTEQAVREALTALLQAGMLGGVYQQALINGEFQINQLAVATYASDTTTANSDDTYLHDQWTLLSDGNDIVDVSAESSVVPTGGAASVKFEVETANKKFGYIQFIENKDALKYAGKTASLQFKAKTAAGKVIRHLRAAVLSWSGTADSLTSDAVASWGAEGTNPTLANNWTAENVSADLTLVADTWTTFKIENISIDTAGMANLAVFIWCDDADAAVDDLLYLSQAQLNVGPICLPYMPRSFADELRLCQRYYEKSYAYGVAPGTASTTGAIYLYLPTAGTGYIMTALFYKVPKRIAVAPTLYDAAGTAGKITYDISTNGKTGTAGQQTESNCRVYSDGTTSKNGILFHYVLDARL